MRQDLPFDPCRTSLRMPSASKRRISKSAIMILTDCGLKVVTAMNFKHESREAIQAIASRIVTMMCLANRIAYSCFTDRKGRLPEHVALNASSIYAILGRLYHLGFLNGSISPKLCARGLHSHRVICMPKTDIIQFIDEGLPCIQQSMKNTLPKYSDATVYGFDLLMKLADRNGLFHYMSG